MAHSLVDQFNRPVSTADLKKKLSGPTVTGVRQVLGGHPAQGLTPGRLAAILREAEDGDAMRYLELAEEMEEKDLHYRSVIATRKLQVSQLEITVAPASDDANDMANAELVEAFIERDELQEEICDILDAVGKGFSVTEIIWETSEKQWMPHRLEWRYPQWFEYDRGDGRTLMLKGDDGRLEPLAPFKFITHVHKSKSGLPIRGGLARAAAWSYLFKNYDIKDWVAFAEVYGMPIRLGKFHAGASEDERAILLRAVRDIGSDAAAIIPEGMAIEFVEAKISGNIDLFERLAQYLDRQVSKAVLGQTLTTEVGDKGSFAASKTHDNVRGDIEKSDARQLAAALNRDLVRPMVALNRGPQKAYPRLQIGRPEETDVTELADALAKLVPVGLKVSQAEVRRKIGMGEPDDDSDLLAAPAPAAPPGNPPAPGDDGGADETAAASACPSCGAVHAAARRGRERDPADDLTDALEATVGEAMDEIIGQIAGLVETASSMKDLSERLLELFPDISVKDLGAALAQALAVAELKGRADIAERD